MRNCIRIVQFEAGQVKEGELAGHVAGNGRQKCMRIIGGEPDSIKPLRLYSHRQQNNN
jgi:hypothetical protein